MLCPNCKRAQVQGLTESRLPIREDEEQGIVSFEAVLTIPIISPHRLISRSTILLKDLYKAVEGPNTRPTVLSIFTGLHFRR